MMSATLKLPTRGPLREEGSTLQQDLKHGHNFRDKGRDVRLPETTTLTHTTRSSRMHFRAMGGKPVDGRNSLAATATRSPAAKHHQRYKYEACHNIESLVCPTVFPCSCNRRQCASPSSSSTLTRGSKPCATASITQGTAHSGIHTGSGPSIFMRTLLPSLTLRARPSSMAGLCCRATKTPTTSSRESARTMYLLDRRGIGSKMRMSCVNFLDGLWVRVNIVFFGLVLSSGLGFTDFNPT